MIEIVCAFINAFLLTFLVIPAIIKASRTRGLLEEAVDHRIHTVPIPTFGGLGIFIGAFFSILLWTPYHYSENYQYILSALLIILLIGAKDDLVPMAPYKKLLGEIFACLLLIVMADIRLTSMYGVFGIADLSYINSVLLTLFTMVVIINAFNLIDGINGLSGSVSTLVAGFFGVWFMLVGRIELAIISLSLAGSMIAFLKYNVTPAKIYMGDTGSLMTGAIMSILAVSFIEQHNVIAHSVYAFASAPAVAFSLLVLPLFDTLRVFAIRVLKGSSPFTPDRNHVHHLLLDAGMNHSQAVTVLLAFNVSAFLLVVNIQHFNTLLIIGVLVCISFILTLLLKRATIAKKSFSPKVIQ
tara:strand:+ start:11681 stop:12745 length:1065 start_codon:yes stop_codon:yes gene_type:complete